MLFEIGNKIGVIGHQERDAADLGVSGHGQSDGVWNGQMDHVGFEFPDPLEEGRPGRANL